MKHLIFFLAVAVPLIAKADEQTLTQWAKIDAISICESRIGDDAFVEPCERLLRALQASQVWRMQERRSKDLETVQRVVEQLSTK
jgi:hypothetical protein